ncbi:MAG: transglutaminase domain-containing protein, partial [Chryseolinea sp.]
MKYIACTLFVQLILSSVLHAQIADFSGTDFDVADSIADQYPNHSLQDLAALAYKLTRSLSTEQQKFRAIFKWVCDNIDNDYGLYLKNKHQRERLKDSNALNIWNKKISHKVIKDLIDQHTTICTGYAYLIRELSICAGLDCKVIDGYGRNVQSNIGGDGILNHSWNAIRLNDKWYLCDATWSAGSYDMKNSMYTRKFDDAYFLSDPTFFVLKHYPVDSAWILLMKKPTLRMFLDGPIVYLAALQYKVLP